MKDIMKVLGAKFIATSLADIHESGDMPSFLEFAREEAKKDGMDTADLMKFFDFLEELEESDGVNWFKLIDTVQKVTGCQVRGFKGDSCIIIKNEELDDDDLKEYLLNDTQVGINLEHINNALKMDSVKLEFIEAMNIPFDFSGFRNFCRFKVVKLDST